MSHDRSGLIRMCWEWQWLWLRNCQSHCLLACPAYPSFRKKWMTAATVRDHSIRIVHRAERIAEGWNDMNQTAKVSLNKWKFGR